MNKTTRTIAIATVAIVGVAVVLWAGLFRQSGSDVATTGQSGGSQASKQAPASKLELTGHMQSFQVAPSTKARPADTWKDANGKPVSLANFDGKVVMVNFWATWCPPCIRELPSINRLQAGLGGQDFTVVALNIDQGGKPIAQRMAKRLKLDKLPLYLDRSSAVAKSWKLRSMPTTIIFDRKGREVGKLEGGAEWDTKEAFALIKFFIDHPNHADNLPPRKGT